MNIYALVVKNNYKSAFLTNTTITQRLLKE